MSIASLFGASGVERFGGCELSAAAPLNKWSRRCAAGAPRGRSRGENGRHESHLSAKGRSERPQDRLVTLIRKPGCHLCDDAQQVIEKVCGDLGVPWEQKDITQDAELHREYWEQIPVVLVDGAQHTFWRVNEERLRKALTQGLPGRS